MESSSQGPNSEKVDRGDFCVQYQGKNKRQQEPHEPSEEHAPFPRGRGTLRQETLAGTDGCDERLAPEATVEGECGISRLGCAFHIYQRQLLQPRIIAGAAPQIEYWRLGHNALP